MDEVGPAFHPHQALPAFQPGIAGEVFKKNQSYQFALDRRRRAFITRTLCKLASLLAV